MFFGKKLGLQLNVSVYNYCSYLQDSWLTLHHKISNFNQHFLLFPQCFVFFLNQVHIYFMANKCFHLSCSYLQDFWLTLHHKISNFNQHFLLFPQCFVFFLNQVHIYFMANKCFHLSQSKTLLSLKKLTC